MTIETENRLAGPFESDGIQTIFPFKFRVFTREDIVVTVGDGDANAQTEIVLTLDNDYDVSFSDDMTEGNVILKSPIPAGKIIVITSAVSELQLVHLTNKGGMFPEVIEMALDRAVILIQQLRGYVDRSVRVPVTSDVDPNDFYAIVELASAGANVAAEKAEASATRAKSAAEAAETAVNNIGNSVSLAQTSATNAAGSASAAAQAETSAVGSAEEAFAWANNPEDIPVNSNAHPGNYSAFHWSEKAKNIVEAGGIPDDDVTITSVGGVRRLTEAIKASIAAAAAKIGVPTGGTQGQVVSSDAQGNPVWTNPASGLPSGGTAGQFLGIDGDGDPEWVDPPTGGGGSGLPIGTVSATGASQADVGHIKLGTQQTFWPIAGFGSDDGISDLVSKCWVGAAANATAPFFFRCNADGTVRDPAGTHFALPTEFQWEGRYVVETTANARIWNDGWCEQRVFISEATSVNGFQVTLPIPYKDATYIALRNSGAGSSGNLNGWTARYLNVWNKTSAGFQVDISSPGVAATDSMIFTAGYVDPQHVPSRPRILQIKAWDKAVNTGDLDVQEVVNAIQAFQTAMLENDANRTVALYPGGTVGSPGTISNSQRIVVDNPFPDNYVHVWAEVFYSGKWGNPGFEGAGGTSSLFSYGTTALYRSFDNKIVILGGTNGVTANTPTTVGAAFDPPISELNSIPCRIIVTRLGRITP